MTWDCQVLGLRDLNKFCFRITFQFTEDSVFSKNTMIPQVVHCFPELLCMNQYTHKKQTVSGKENTFVAEVLFPWWGLYLSTDGAKEYTGALKGNLSPMRVLMLRSYELCQHRNNYNHLIKTVVTSPAAGYDYAPS